MASAELDLERRAVAGDGEALSALLERHGPAVRRVIAPGIPPRWRSVLSEDDVMQQTYIDAFQDIGRYAPGAGGAGTFAAWLTTAARRNLLDAIRMLGAEKRGGGRRAVGLPQGDESYDRLYEQVSTGSSTPSHKAARGEMVSAMKRAIEALPPAYRQVLVLYDLEGRPAAEVGETLGRSPGAVYMLRSRAQRLLAEALGTASRFLSGSP